MHALPDQRVDVLVARAPLPLAEHDVVTTPLYEEPRVLVVPRDHPLAGRASVTADELAGEEVAPCAFDTDTWTSYRVLGTGARIDRYEDKLELVASGEAIAVLPMGDRRSSLHPDLVTVPVDGAPPSQVVLARRAGDGNPMIEALRSAAADVLGAPTA